MSFEEPSHVESVLIDQADWNWRYGPKWRALVARVFGRREIVRTGRGGLAHLAWWRGEPYLIDIEEVML